MSQEASKAYFEAPSSTFDVAEAILITDLVEVYCREQVEWVVIVPYRAQAGLIREKIDTRLGQELDIDLNNCVATVDTFQGGELEHFYKLPAAMLRKMVDFLRVVGHLDERENGRLHLTPLGQDSIHAKMFYRRLETHRTLHFEAFGSRPLQRDHYDQDRAQKYNLPDEIELTGEIDNITKVFAPLCIIEACKFRTESILDPSIMMGEMANENWPFETRFLVIAKIEGRRDRFFEDALNNEPRIAYRLREIALYPGDQAERVLQEWIEKQ